MKTNRRSHARRSIPQILESLALRMLRIPQRSNARQFLSQRRLKLEPLEDRRLLAGVPELLRDIRPGSFNTDPTELVAVGDVVFFTINSPENVDRELWVSDGSVAGTKVVKDIFPGFNGSHPSRLTEVNGTLFFTAGDGVNGTELWKSDGTAGGTVLVKDIRPGSGGSVPDQLMNVNGTLFFEANDGTSGVELWKSDGTAAGTILVKDINAGPDSSLSGTLSFHTAVGGELYFVPNDGVGGRELWKSDGTEAGTFQVKDMVPGPTGAFPQRLADINGTLFFEAGDGIWKSDGTEAGTVFVSNVHLNSGFTDVNGVAFFEQLGSGGDLWKTDGTAAGTVLVKDFATGLGFDTLTNVNGTLFLFANDGISGPELWKSDGTEVGTTLVKDIQPGAAGSWLGGDVKITNLDGTLYVWATDGTNGAELWKSDGTESGTVLVKDIHAGSGSAKPLGFLNTRLVEAGGVVFFSATDGLAGMELWKTDGSDAGTSMVVNLTPNGPSSGFSQFTNVNGTAFFAANDGTGPEVWMSDGTTAGTTKLKDLNAGNNGSAPNSLTNISGALFFQATTAASGSELWKSDGTAAGTVLVSDIRPGANGSSPTNITDVGGIAYFSADDGTSGVELWRSDGTSAGTERVLDIRPGASGSSPSNLTNVNGTLYFTANDGTSGVELWRSDGTAAGTQRVLDIFPGSGNSAPLFLVNSNGTLFFRATDGVAGVELWKADHTGASQVRDIVPGAGSSSPFGLTNVNGTLYFNANNDLWKSDGTIAGTTVVSTLSPNNLLNVNDTLFFTAGDGTTGTELWKSDGTTTGTVLVKDIVPGPASSSPSILVGVNGKLFFRANDGANGQELWISDGTASGTTMLRDILPGIGSSLPQSLADTGGTLFFTADDGVRGAEPWSMLVEAANANPTATNDAASANEDGPAIVINLTANDLDSNPGDDLQIISVDSGAIGLVTIHPDGDNITYDPDGQFEFLAADETDTDTFSYTISDGNGGTSSAFVTITVTGQNDLPEVEADFPDVVINEGQTATNTGFYFDIDFLDDVTLTASLGTVTKSGTSEGVWEWSSDGVDDESSTITITADDGQGGIVTTAFDLTVNNVRPSNVVVANRALTGNGSNAVFTADVSFADPGDDSWTATINYGDGTIDVLENVGKTFALHHEYIQSGAYRVTIIVTDDDGGSVTKLGNTAIAIGTGGGDLIRVRAGSVIIEHNGVEIAHLEDIHDVLVWGGDGDDDIAVEPALTVSADLVGGPGNDTLVAGAGPTVLSGGPGDDELFGGSGPVTVVGGSGSNLFTPGTGPSTSGSTNPEAFADSFTVAEDGELVVAAAGVLANDVLGSASVSLTVTAINGLAANVGQPVMTQHGLVTLQADGSFSYTPGIGCEATTDSFTYTLSDANGATAAATATISIVKSVADDTTTIDAAGVVRLGGTAGADLIVLSVWNGKLYRNLENTGIPVASITEIRVWGRAGHDLITDLTGLDVKRFIHGGDGNDLLTGGELNDVIFGGNGDDILAGLAGHDVLAGGEGRDRIAGSSGHDILVAGEVDCGLSLEELREISHAWATTRTVAADAVDEFLDETTQTDGDADQLTGSSGADLFLIHSGDNVTDFKFGKPKTNKDGDVVIKDGVITT